MNALNFTPAACLAVVVALAAGFGQATDVTVIDADTIDLNGERIRLHGIDAPESRQFCYYHDGREWPCGEAATAALVERIGSQTVTCDALDVDRYGRIIGHCYAGGHDLNEWLVSEGWAVAYRRYSLDYVGSEDAARAAERGVWSGQFVMPWDWRRARLLGVPLDWRRDQRAERVADERPGCLIKGNINSRGERIYHEPGGQWYERTRIDTANGERWFCSREEAEAAGWRRSGLIWR